MSIELRDDASRPLYLQIRNWFQNQIERGVLLPGARLPASRALAADLGVSRVTVVNAYAELEAEGWVRAHVGRGTFVCDPGRWERSGRDTPYGWESTFLGPSGVSAGGMVSDMLHLAQHRDLISFAMGAPATDLLPVRQFREMINQVLRRDGGEALQYDEAIGYEPLRRRIAGMLAAEGIAVGPRELLITSGSQQGLDLATRVLTESGDVVITESPTYVGALDVLRSNGVRVMGVPVDGEGMRVDVLEKVLSSCDPRFIYTIPDFHNPTGVTLSLERRRRLVQLARQWEVPILEDGVCSELRYEGTSVPSLRALDGGERVLYINSFSKSLLPGIRVGYMVVPRWLRERLVLRKQAADLFTSSLMQRALAHYLDGGRLSEHLASLRRVYRDRRDGMLAGLARRMPAGTNWIRPQGGLCLWATLPEGMSAGELYLAAIDHGVAFAVGSVFFPEDADRSSLRLNFASHRGDVIEEGLRRLARAVQEQLPGSAAKARRPDVRTRERVSITERRG